VIARIVLAAAALLAAVLLVGAVASGLAGAACDRLADRRTRSVVAGLHERLESDLQLGLALADDDRLQPLVEDEVASTPRLLALEVVSPRGISVFSSDRGLLGQPVPAAWLAAMAARPGGWVVARSEDRALGIALRDARGEVAGYLVPTYRRAAPEVPVLAALPAFAALACALALGLRGWHERAAALRRRAELARLRAPAAGDDDPLAAAARRIDEARHAIERADERARAIAEGEA
jgi:hypothetical protein